MRRKVSVAIVAAGIIGVVTAGAVSAAVLSGRMTDTAAVNVADVSSPQAAPSPALPFASATPSATASPTPSATPSPKPKPTASPKPKPVATTAVPAKAKPRPPKTYTVLPGDNLFVIAAWFKLQGYGDLFERNRAVIGDNPDLIRPGQTITISEGGVNMG